MTKKNGNDRQEAVMTNRVNISKRKLIAIVGPTASGKTAVGVELAKEFSGEIVSADSRQVFRGLDLGTGKDLHEYDGVKYHLIDIKNPGEKFTLFDYLPLARTAIEDIFSRGKVPIIVGGTGLYVQALVEGFEIKYSVIPAHSVNSGQTPAGIFKIPDQVGDDKYERNELEKLSVEQLQSILQELDIESYENLADKQNPHRLIRAIERAESGDIVEKKKPDFEVLQIGLEWPREELNKRIDKRVDDRFEQGMLAEVEGLLKLGVDPEWLLKLGLEYKIITDFILACHPEFISGSQNQEMLKQVQHDNRKFEETKELLKLRSHQYAKRQMTWFKRFPEIVWESDYEEIHKLVQNYLNKN
jgi:tRNA dimethylallyltransferase